MTYSPDCIHCWYMGAEQSPCLECLRYTKNKEHRDFFWKGNVIYEEKESEDDVSDRCACAVDVVGKRPATQRERKKVRKDGRNEKHS